MLSIYSLYYHQRFAVIFLIHVLLKYYQESFCFLLSFVLFSVGVKCHYSAKINFLGKYKRKRKLLTASSLQYGIRRRKKMYRWGMHLMVVATIAGFRFVCLYKKMIDMLGNSFFKISFFCSDHYGFLIIITSKFKFLVSTL